MASWTRFALALASAAIAASSASAWHLDHMRYYPAAPAAGVYAPSAATYAAPASSYAYAAAPLAYGVPAASYGVAPSYAYSIPPTTSYAVGPSAYTYSAANYSAPVSGYAFNGGYISPASASASAIQAQALDLMLLKNLLHTVFDNQPSGNTSSDLADRVSKLESRVSKLEKRKSSTKKNDGSNDGDGGHFIGTGDPEDQAVQTQKVQSDPVQDALNAMIKAQQAADDAQLAAERALHVLQRQEENNQGAIQRLQQYLKPAAPGAVPPGGDKKDKG